MYPSINWKLFKKEPAGKLLEGKKAKEVIDGWRDEQQAVLSKQGSFIAAAKKVENRTKALEAEIPKAAAEVKKAIKGYKSVKTDVSKARWARRLVLANQLHTYVRESSQLLNATIERVKDAIEDGKIVIRIIDNQIKDAEMYYQLNGQLKLVGKALAAAREQHVMPEIEYQHVEFTMEQIEAKINSEDDNALIEQAERLISDGGK